MTNFNYGDIIEYIDGTLDENFNAARKWALSHKTTFEELFDRRSERKEEEKYIEEVPVEKEIVVPAKTHEETIPAEYDDEGKIISEEHTEIIIDEPETVQKVTEYENQEKTRFLKVLYRYFQIGPEYVPSEDEIKARMIAIRDSYFSQYVDWYQSKPLLWDEMDEKEKQSIAEYRLYLKSYNDAKDWWKKEPLNYDDWKGNKG